MRRHPDQRPDGRQLEALRSELHAIVDAVIGSWPVVERQARDMGRGFPSQSDGPSGSGGVSRPVERIALEERSDPGAVAAEVLVELDEMVAMVRRMDRRVRGCLPVPAASVERGRVSSVDACELCGEPILEKAKRIDGLPYHASSCYFRVWRAGRGG